LEKIVKNSIITVVAVIIITLIFPSVIYADTSKIAFSSNRDGNHELYTMNADGSNQTRLTSNTANDIEPSLSFNGTRIAFSSNRDGNKEIYIMNADGSNQTRLTNNTAFDEVPSLSPDGTKIAFVSYRDSNYEIYIMNADGTNVARLTNQPSVEYAPSFSPDGSKIAFYSSRDGNYEIYTMNTDGTNMVRLTNNLFSDLAPSFSPDGSKIAFYSRRDDNYEIYTMNADGSNQTRLTNNSSLDYHPSFSPDGSKIAFASYRDSNYDIYIMDADGSNQTKLTNNMAYNDFPSFSFPFVAVPPSSPNPVNKINEESLSFYANSSLDFITFLYNRVLIREPDDKGYNEWVTAIAENSFSATDLVTRFVSSIESQDNISGYSNEQFIVFLYKSLLNRLPDSQGYENWVLNMNEGMGKEEVLINFCHSPEFQEICNYFNIEPY
jgi:tricorn protease-like protein